jgi:hypothetical protein
MLGVGPDQPVTESSRKLGVDLAKVAAGSDETLALGYVDSPERLQTLLACYRDVLGADANLAVALRPLLPDGEDQSLFIRKAEVAARAGAKRIDFYHYAMMPLGRLNWIAAAMAAATASVAKGKTEAKRS